QAMVFQRPVMLRRSVSANVEYALGLRGVSKNARQAQIDEVLSRTGLQRFARTPARVLSFGEQQKLALARAWALNPQVLFLDEPTASLDPAGTRAVEQIIAAIQSGGTKIIMTTHDLGQARRLGDEILFLHQGKLIEKTEAQSFFERPASNLGQAFLNGDLLW
ncbi:MAG: ATP-binding cassette domain-containing protein, partial [Rhodospirillaceae bacterium]|nr:ATP-binding cassette domain-containing protein [Rhodospirillaceae bacterium]